MYTHMHIYMCIYVYVYMISLSLSLSSPIVPFSNIVRYRPLNDRVELLQLISDIPCFSYRAVLEALSKHYCYYYCH